MCQKKGHLVAQCDKSSSNCKRRHHQSICQAQSPGETLNCHLPPPEEKLPQGEPETQVPNSEMRVSTTNTEAPTTQQTTSTSSAQSLNSIDILSSSDHYWDFVTGESIRGDFGPTAVKSKLGWLLSGPTNNSQNETNVVSDLVITGESFSNGAKESDEMADMLERLWDVEGLGIVETNYESELVKRKGDITFNYEVELPWRGDCLPQSNNYEICVTVIPFKIEEGAEFAEGRKRKKGIVENCAGDRRSNAR